MILPTAKWETEQMGDRIYYKIRLLYQLLYSSLILYNYIKSREYLRVWVLNEYKYKEAEV